MSTLKYCFKSEPVTLEQHLNWPKGSFFYSKVALDTLNPQFWLMYTVKPWFNKQIGLKILSSGWVYVTKFDELKKCKASNKNWNSRLKCKTDLYTYSILTYYYTAFWNTWFWLASRNIPTTFHMWLQTLKQLIIDQFKWVNITHIYINMILYYTNWNKLDYIYKWWNQHDLKRLEFIPELIIYISANQI